MKFRFITLIALTFLLGCEGDLLNKPLGAVTVTLSNVVATPGTDTVVITWTSNVDTRNQIEYGTSSGLYTSASPASSSDSKSHSVTLTNLSASTQYYFRINSVYQTSFQVKASEATFTTLATASVTLTSGPTTTPTTSTCLIAWNTSSTVYHQVDYGTATGTYTKATVLTGSTATVHSETLTGLTPGVQYFYRIRSVASTGELILHTEASFTTTAFTFSAGPTASNITTTSADISWTANIASAAILDYGTSTGSYTLSTPVDSSLTTAHTKNLTGLTSGITYYYRIRSFTDSLGNYTSAESTFITTAVVEPSLARKLAGVWMVGGLSGATIATPVSTLDLYDPTNDTWYSNAASGATGTFVPVSFAGIVGYSGKIYVIGGFDSTGVVRNLVQIYNISTNAWSTGTAMTTALANITAVLNPHPSGARIHIISGSTGAAAAAWAASNTNYEYNIGGNSWTTRLAPGVNVSNRHVAFFNDIVYTYGGRTAAATLATTHEGWVYSANAYSTGATEVILTTAKMGATTGIYQPATGPAVMILVGGLTVSTGTTGNWVFTGTTAVTATNNVQFLFYPFTAPSTWLAGTGGLSANVAYAASVMVGSKYYHFGGNQTVAPNPFNTVAYTDLAAITPSALGNTWNTQTAMPTARYGHSAVVIQ